jgi:hypothetical protein
LGTGATFAQAKGVTAMAVQVELVVIRRSTQVTHSTIPIFLGAVQGFVYLDTRGHLDPNSNFIFLFLVVPASSFANEPVLPFVGRSTPIGGDFFV